MILITLLCLTEVDPKTALFSWKYIDGPYAFVDPTNLPIPSFDNWEISGSTNEYDNKVNYISLNYRGSAQIKFVFQSPSSQDCSLFNFQCLNEQNQSIESAICTLNTPNETICVKLGDSKNFTASLIDNETTISITMKNSQTSTINFSLPIITCYRSPFYSDISFTQQYPVKGQTKAVFCELFLNQSIGKIELHTIHVNSPHRIPSAFNPHNQIFKGEGSTSFEFTTLPIISSETRIVGMNIFDSTLKLWRLYEADDNSEIGYCVDIEPVPPFRVTYIIIETSSINFPDALEIWHNQFNNSFLLPDPESNYGSIATPSTTNDFCLKSFYQRHMWGGEHIDGFPPMKTFLPMEKFTLTIPVEPDDILKCADNKSFEYFESCNLVKNFGIVTKSRKFSLDSRNDDNCTYNVIWSQKIKNAYESVNDYIKEHSYSGFAIDLSIAETMNYNLDLDDPQYYLIDKDGDRFKPTISSMYQLLYLYRDTNLIKDGNILISDFFHPQFINVIVTQGVVVNLIDPNHKNEYRLKYSLETHNRLWRVRAQMGSSVFTILEQSDPRSVLHISDDFFSICLTLGALPSFYYPAWSDCPYLDYIDKLRAVYESWRPLFQQLLYCTTYNANGIGLIRFYVDPKCQIPPIPDYENSPTIEDDDDNNHLYSQKKFKRLLTTDDDEEEDEEADTSYSFGTIGENNCFFEASTYCNREDTEEDGVIDCFEAILIGINVTLNSADDQINIQRVVNVTFSSEKSPTCLFVSSPLICTVNGRTVDIILNTTISASSAQNQMYRVALINFKIRIGQSFNEWFRENLWAIILSLLFILLLFIAMGLGLWCMYCRKKRDNGDLTRIKNREREVTKTKRNTLTKLNEQLNTDKSENEDEFKVIDDA